MMDLSDQITACQICATRFAATITGHRPRPVVWFQPGTRILIAGQAPGARVYESGVPFDDRSGDRLREWLGIDRAVFYDRARVSIFPMALCFPGYDKNGADLPPPAICATTWRAPALDQIGQVPLTLLIGGYAQTWHLGTKIPVTARVARWRDHAPHVFPLPHPSWRNTGWIKKNPWFETELLPTLQARIKDALQ